MLKAFAPIEFQTIVAAYVAKTHESILVRNLEVHRTNFTTNSKQKARLPCTLKLTCKHTRNPFAYCGLTFYLCIKQICEVCQFCFDILTMSTPIRSVDNVFH